MRWLAAWIAWCSARHRALEGERNRSLGGALQSADAEPRGAPLYAGAGSRAGRGARPQADRTGAGGHRNRTPVSLSMPIRNMHRTVGAMLSGEIARRYGSAGLPDDTIRVQFHRMRGTKLWRVSGEGRDADARRRSQRLRRQGTFRRKDDHLSAAQVRVRAGRKYPDRQRLPLRRNQRRGFFQRHGRRALCRAQFRRDGRGGRRGRSRLRVHDQRIGGGAGARGTEFRGRHDRRHRLRAGSDAAISVGVAATAPKWTWSR